jgi:hypothetical protein
VFSLRRQWGRFQLARELLEQYEYEEEHRLPVSEAMRLIESVPDWRDHLDRPGSTMWAEAVRKKAEQYPSDA